MFEKKVNVYEKTRRKKQAPQSKNTLAKDANALERYKFVQEHSQVVDGAMSLTSTGNEFVDDFGKLSTYLTAGKKDSKGHVKSWGREIVNIFKTMSLLASIDLVKAVLLMCYIRIITRTTKLLGKEYNAKGQGLRKEYLGRLMWLAANHKDLFQKNLRVFIALGSWQDIFDLMELEVQYGEKVLNWKFLAVFILQELSNPEQSELIKKYMPTIKSISNCKTEHNKCCNVIAKRLAQYWFNQGKTMDKNTRVKCYNEYRKLKASGKAHLWQRQISQGDFNKINFNTIGGRALNLLAKTKFLKNHGLENKFKKFIMSKPVAKYTGFVHELFKGVKSFSDIQWMTVEKQFAGLIDTAKKGADTQTGFVVAIDGSGSMGSPTYCCPNMCSFDMAKAFVLYFSNLLEGKFKNTYIQFNTKAVIANLPKGNVKTQWNSIRSFGGYTNLINVATLFVDVLKSGAKEEEMPSGLLCISDGDFNVGSNSLETTAQTFLKELRKGGFSKEYVDNFKVVIWDIPNTFMGINRNSKFQALASAPNVFTMAGFDPSCISFLTGMECKKEGTVSQITPEELFNSAISQDILKQLVF